MSFVISIGEINLKCIVLCEKCQSKQFIPKAILTVKSKDTDLSVIRKINLV